MKNMYKKRFVVFIGILLMITIFTSSISVTAYNDRNLRSETVYKYGVFLLTCIDIEGINHNNHIGGLSNIDIIATSEEFILATLPIWGTTLIENEVEIHITMDNFFGVIQEHNNGQIQFVGLCKNIAWEFI
jgi:hypothetical protein